jgi:ParB/RepB/Spo0J family partition protein
MASTATAPHPDVPKRSPLAPAYDLRTIPIEQIRHSTNNPRSAINPGKQRDLEASVRAKGIQTPIGVRPIHGGLFEVVHGERRVRAAEAVGVATVPAIVTEMTDDEAYEAAAVENLQRHEMGLMDEADVYARLAKPHKTHPEVAISRRTGVPESRVYRLLRYTTLEPVFQKALREDRLSMGHADALVRLTPTQRKDAMDRDLVWRQSPLFRDREAKWVPTKDDLVPLHELQHYIQERTAFDPNADDLRHFQPELADARETAITHALADRDETEDVDGGPAPTLLRLSADSLVRMKTGLNEKTAPLSPSRWKEVKPGSCEHATLGAIVHGGPGRVLTVCIKRSCKKHWPQQPKKKRTTAASASKPAKAEVSYQERERLQRIERTAWEAFEEAAVRPAMVTQTAGLKFSAGLVRSLLDSYDLKGIETRYGVKLTDATAAQVLWLNAADDAIRYGSDADTIANDLKPFGFDAAPFAKKYKAERAAVKKAAAKTATPATGKKTAKKGSAA